MQERPCRSCGTRIAIVPTKDGKHIPLDLVAPVYELQSDGQLSRAERARGYYVSHFASCPHADAHSKTKKRSPAGVAGGQGRGADGVEGSAAVVLVCALGLLALVVAVLASGGGA